VSRKKQHDRYQGNPFRRVGYIPPVNEILKMGFNKAAAVQFKQKRSRKKSREEKIAALEAKRISALSSYICTQLEKIISQFPWIEDMHPFYISLCAVFGDIAKIKQILGRLKGISEQIKKIEKEELKKLKETTHPQQTAKIRQSAYGRFASLVKKAKGDIKYLIRVTKKAKTIPDFDMTIPSVVVAGAPNVGKSSLVRSISTGKPEIGEYPFTTKKIIFGHRNLFFTMAQVVDTPGILDRPFGERNIIELQSISTIRYISDIIIILFDTSYNASLKPDEQLNLLNDIKMNFPQVPIIRVLNKIDLLSDEEIEKAKSKFNTDFEISTKENINIDLLAKNLDELIIHIWKTNDKFKEQSKIEISEEYIDQIEDEDLEYEDIDYNL